MGGGHRLSGQALHASEAGGDRGQLKAIHYCLGGSACTFDLDWEHAPEAGYGPDTGSLVIRGWASIARAIVSAEAFCRDPHARFRSSRFRPVTSIVLTPAAVASRRGLALLALAFAL